MMGDKTITPTIEESAMFHAQAASVKSGCLSRQVGASIIDQNGILLSTGCNDVPKAGGGLYTIEDGENDSRCMYKYGGKCKNQQRRELIFSDLEKIIKNSIKTESDVSKIISEIKENDSLNNLIEFCRAIHAEMDAITKVAKNGGVSLNQASLFTTTFPCHNCARHIIAAGISKIYYIEPYEKSLAIELHNDALVFDTGKGKNKNQSVELKPFEGVSPNKYLKLFTAENRKKGGVRTEHDRKTAKPALPVLLETRYDYETKILENLIHIGFPKEILSKNIDTENLNL